MRRLGGLENLPHDFFSTFAQGGRFGSIIQFGMIADARLLLATVYHSELTQPSISAILSGIAVAPCPSPEYQGKPASCRK